MIMLWVFRQISQKMRWIYSQSLLDKARWIAVTQFYENVCLCWKREGGWGLTAAWLHLSQLSPPREDILTSHLLRSSVSSPATNLSYLNQSSSIHLFREHIWVVVLPAEPGRGSEPLRNTWQVSGALYSCRCCVSVWGLWLRFDTPFLYGVQTRYSILSVGGVKGGCHSDNGEKSGFVSGLSSSYSVSEEWLAQCSARQAVVSLHQRGRAR